MFCPNTSNESFHNTLIGACGIKVGKITKELKEMTPSQKEMWWY